MSFLKSVFIGLIEGAIRNIDGPFGRAVRKFYYSRTLKTCGKNLSIGVGVIIRNARCVSVGDNVWIDDYVSIVAGPFHPNGRKFAHKQNLAFTGNDGELTIGNNCHIATHAIVQAHGGVVIGSNVTLAAGSKVYSLSHHYRNTADQADKKSYHFSTMAAKEDQFLIKGAVVIADACAVGLNSIVMPATHIPAGTWLGVSSTIQGTDLQTDAVYIGNPGRFVKSKQL